MCSSMCGGGTETCAAGAWSGCTASMPAPETCDGRDEDCDARVDEGLPRMCSTACGTGNETCVSGRYAGCTAPAPRTETCDGTDESCDGRVDDGLTRACASACGSGTERCTLGSWGGCTAPMPAAEACNDRDDDCDGTVDETVRVVVYDPVAMSELTAKQPPCTGPTSGLDVCMSASTRWCSDHTSGCYIGGAGFLQAVSSSARIVCLGNEADRRDVAFTTITTASGISVSDANAYTRQCQGAINRYCRSVGFDGGIGPLEHSGGMAAVLCLPSSISRYTDVPTSELRARGCDPLTEADQIICASAADEYCRGAGHLAGFGPVEWNDTDSAVVCLRR
jgi:hypothetical protein